VATAQLKVEALVVVLPATVVEMEELRRVLAGGLKLADRLLL